MISLLEEVGYTPKEKAACNGGEYSSSCPFCKDGDDRFVIWPKCPNKNGLLQGGRFFCRVCRKHGDAISFLQELYGLTYREACARLHLEPFARKRSRLKVVKQDPPLAKDPSILWQAKGKAFVDWCHLQLLFNPDAFRMLTARGFNKDSIVRFKLGFCPDTIFRRRESWGLESIQKQDDKPKKLWLPRGIVIPSFTKDDCLLKIKIRRSDWVEGDKFGKYVEISGSKQSPAIYGDTSLSCGFVLESELDGLLIQQEAGDLCYSVSLGGSTKPIDRETDALLRRSPSILFCPDFDEAGAVAWVKWRKQFPNIQRILTPIGKGPGDAFVAGVNLREWIKGSIV